MKNIIKIIGYISYFGVCYVMANSGFKLFILGLVFLVFVIISNYIHGFIDGKSVIIGGKVEEL